MWVGSSATPARAVFPVESWLLSAPLALAWGQVTAAVRTGSVLPLHHVSLGQFCSPHWEPRTATHRGAQRRVQGTLLPLHAKSRHKQFLKCPRQVLRQAHVLKGLCIFEKSVWPFSQAGKVRICV